MLKALFTKQKKNEYGWFGDYSSWGEVSSKAEGYDTDDVINKTRASLLKVKSGAANYERDAVVFDQKEYPYSVIAYLILSAKLNKAPLHILDFGGSLGTTYYQIKDFLTPDVCSSWNVVEQENYVKVGKTDFEDDTLKFYGSIDACLEDKKLDLILLSSSVQYLKEPHVFLESLIKYNIDFVIFDRTAFNNAPKDRLTLQIVPPEIYSASYPAWFFNEKKFLNHFTGRYNLIAEFPSYVIGEQVMLIDNKPAASDKGFYFINKTK
jgi:putative methyltransferase (TIGR04325 family)